ncbi:MAG: DUF5654 family protein [Candidatus Bathyarchaeia archaeon]
MSGKKVTMAEIRKTIATSLGTAFGIVIGMIWTNVVLGAFATAGISLTTIGGTWFEWFYFVIVAIIVTVICVIAIVLIGRWGGRE